MADFPPTMMPAFVGVTSALLTILIGAVIHTYREKRDRLEAQIGALWLLKQEFTFYISRLDQLGNETRQLIKDGALVHRGGLADIITPSYTLYPDVIGEAKMKLVEVYVDENPTVLASICELHFELEHVTLRLEATKKEWAVFNTAPGTQITSIDNAVRFLGLVVATKSRFEKLIPELDSELSKKRERKTFLALEG